jgi:SAM-dependent methyltransferase
MFDLSRFWSRPQDKYGSEVAFWVGQIKEYQSWYEGDLPELFGTKSPAKRQRVKAPNLKDSAILTWFELHQKPKYLYDLDLGKEAFKGMKLLDVGAGPMPSAACFEGADLYCLDPLYHRYLEVGFPLHYYEDVKFVHGFSEQMPLEDDSFDAVLSVNAIDHVDDFEATAAEIRRVLKPGGRLALHIHYHLATPTEPLELNNAIVERAFSWCQGLQKLKESHSKLGWNIPEEQSYTLWRNF